MSYFTQSQTLEQRQAVILPGLSGRFTRSLIRLSSLLNLWISRHRQRKQLAQVESFRLDDLGLTPQQVQQEISKPFWK